MRKNLKMARVSVTLPLILFSLFLSGVIWALPARAGQPPGRLAVRKRLRFGRVLACTQNRRGKGLSKTKNLVIKNKGPGPVTFSGTPSVTGQNFSLAPGNTCTATLAPKRKCIIPIRFEPFGSGKVTGTLTISDDASNGQHQVVTLLGAGMGKLTCQTVTTGRNGTATFKNPPLTVQVQDVGSQLPLPGIDVTLLRQGSLASLFEVDPSKQYQSGIFTLPQGGSANPLRLAAGSSSSQIDNQVTASIQTRLLNLAALGGPGIIATAALEGGRVANAIHTYCTNNPCGSSPGAVLCSTTNQPFGCMNNILDAALLRGAVALAVAKAGGETESQLSKGALNCIQSAADSLADLIVCIDPTASMNCSSAPTCISGLTAVKNKVASDLASCAPISTLLGSNTQTIINDIVQNKLPQTIKGLSAEIFALGEPLLSVSPEAGLAITDTGLTTTAFDALEGIFYQASGYNWDSKFNICSTQPPWNAVLDSLTFLWPSEPSAPSNTSASISGIVSDASNSAPLSGATVDIAGQMGEQMTTAADGTFKFKNLIPGTYYEYAEDAGFETKYETVGKVLSGQNVIAPLELQPIPSSPPSTWAQLSPVASPSARGDGAMAFDPAIGKIVLFGGANSSTINNETWTFDGNTWTQLHPANSPSGRNYFGMAYDGTTGLVTLYGGCEFCGSMLGDTWTFDGRNWTQQNPATSPPGRDNISLAYDEANQTVVLFSGSTAPYVQGPADTWTWDGTNWTQQNPVNSPPPRQSYSMAYDRLDQGILLFGGSNGSGQLLDDTWLWSGSNWDQEFPTTSPPARSGATMVYDPELGGVVLFGGSGANGLLDDTWLWNGSNWMQLSPTTFPSPRAGYQMDFDSAIGKLVLFGGQASGGFLGDTWDF